MKVSVLALALAVTQGTAGSGITTAVAAVEPNGDGGPRTEHRVGTRGRAPVEERAAKRGRTPASAVRLPRVRIAPVPVRSYLSGVPHEYQRPNNCAVVTTNMVLGYWGTYLSQAYTQDRLRPHPADVAVGDVEMVNFARIEYGYAGKATWGGDMRLLEALVANGIPVVVLQPLTAGSDLNHFRIVRGYNRARGVVILNDSYFGPDLVWSYAYFESLWGKREFSYQLIYPRSRRALVAAIERRYLPSRDVRLRRDLARSRRAAESEPNDARAWLRLGDAAYHRGHGREALLAWERANRLGLPEEALWYTTWPVRLLNDLGRFGEAHDLADHAVDRNPADAEMLYELGRAHRALGEPDQAREDLALALRLAPYHPTMRRAGARDDRGR